MLKRIRIKYSDMENKNKSYTRLFRNDKLIIKLIEKFSTNGNKLQIVKITPYKNEKEKEMMI